MQRESHIAAREIKILSTKTLEVWKLTDLLCQTSPMTDLEGLLKKFLQGFKTLHDFFSLWIGKISIVFVICCYIKKDLRSSNIIFGTSSVAFSDCRLIGAAAGCQGLTNILIYWTFLVLSHHSFLWRFNHLLKLNYEITSYALCTKWTKILQKMNQKLKFLRDQSVSFFCQLTYRVSNDKMDENVY